MPSDDSNARYPKTTPEWAVLELLLIWIVIDYALGFSAPFVTRTFSFDQFFSLVPLIAVTGQLTVAAMWLVLGSRHWLSRLIIPCGLFAALHLFYELRVYMEPHRIPDWIGQGKSALNGMALTYFVAQCLVLMLIRWFGIHFQSAPDVAPDRRLNLRTFFSLTTAAALAIFAAQRFKFGNLQREVLGVLVGQVYFIATLLLTVFATRFSSARVGYLVMYGVPWLVGVVIIAAMSVRIPPHAPAWIMWHSFLSGIVLIFIQPLTMSLSIEYLALRGLTLRPSQKTSSHEEYR